MGSNSIHENSLNINDTRQKQIQDLFEIKKLEPECTDEYIKIPIDLPWQEMEKDVPLAYEKFGWYGMIHRRKNNWKRSRMYGGLGLTYNPDYIFDMPEHAQCLGQPRSNITLKQDTWVKQTVEAKYEGQSSLKNTYNDCLGLRIPTAVTQFRSFKVLFDMIGFNLIQGRMAEIRPKIKNPEHFESVKEFHWHIDEDNEFVTRLLIPVVYSEDYYIEFAETGNKIIFEPGYAYHWDTRKMHRWGFNYSPSIQNRTCIVLGISPWLTYENDTWSANKYCNKVHPTDMMARRYII